MYLKHSVQFSITLYHWIIFKSTIRLYIYNINLLGIIIDNKLTWKPHIANIRTKISKALGTLNKVKHNIPTKLKRQLYFSLIHPHLLYGVELWGAAVKSHIQLIQILQKRAIRFITSSTYNSSTHNYFKDLKILKMQDLYQVQLLTQMYV